jgi:hypothetical protein
MHHSNCEICGQVATHHETVIAGGLATTIDRCSEHGQPTWREAVAEAQSRLGTDLDAAIEELRQIVLRDLGPGGGRHDA